jgi:signal transduction histidine kinase
MGYIELLMAGDLGPLTEKQREALYVVRKRVDALQRRTRDLTTLDTLSGKEAKAHPTSIVDVVHTALAEVKRQATVAGVQLCEQVPDTLSPVMANKEHLVQAVTHLIDNAVKFSPDGGTVTVRAWEEDGHACIAVDDEGIGIEPQHLDHVFKRFYQVDGSINRRFSGMGVGLAVVWEIIEVYGGTVDVESTPNEGSSFIISLPRADENDFQRAISLAQAEIEKVKGPSA